MKKKIMALLLACSSAFAIDFGLFTLDIEGGALINYTQTKMDAQGEGTLKNKDHLAYGAYGRVWLGAAGFMIAPQVKWDYLKDELKTSGSSNVDFKLQNLQYGGVLGYRIPFIDLTPYVGLSYSQFISGDIAGIKLKDTYAINFGAMWKIPFIPLSIGFDGSYQKPKLKDNKWNAKEIEVLTLGATIGFIF